MYIRTSTGHQAALSQTMRSIGMAIFLLLMLSYMHAVHAGDLYRWQDEAGKMRYSDKIPPPGAKNVTRMKSGSTGLVVDRKAAADEPVQAVQPVNAEVAANPYPLVLFSFSDCAPCKSAEDFLNKRGVPYTLKNQEQDKIELKQRTGKLEVPVLLVGKEILNGFEEVAWSKLLDAAGYAKGNPKIKVGSLPTKETPAGQ